MVINLLRKELLSQKISIILFAFFWFIPFTQFFTDGTPIMHVGLLILLATWLPFYSAYYDKETLINSLPVKRKQVVQAKYLSGFMWYIPAAIIVMVYVLLFYLFAPFPTRLMTGQDLLLALSGVCILLSIFYPFYFAFGYIISYIVTLISSITVVIGLNIIVNIYHNPRITFINPYVDMVIANQTLTIVLATAISLVITFLSYLLSVRIYEKKDI